jgi:hypothetical protein
VTYREWCEANDCSHGHCPLHCEHPQPEVLEGGRVVCGSCLSVGLITDVVPCGEDNC